MENVKEGMKNDLKLAVNNNHFSFYYKFYLHNNEVPWVPLYEDY